MSELLELGPPIYDPYPYKPVFFDWARPLLIAIGGFVAAGILQWYFMPGFACVLGSLAFAAIGGGGAHRFAQVVEDGRRYRQWQRHLDEVA